jgi:hypothetical protein
MKKHHFIYSILLIFQSGFWVCAQNTTNDSPSLVSAELTLNNLISGGFNTNVFFSASKRWSFGVGLGNGPIDGLAKDLVFQGNNLDALDIDLPMIVGLTGRYFLGENQRGFYGQIAVGNEIFRIRNQSAEQTIHNQFAVIAAGFLWKFNRQNPKGLYLNANIGANFVWNTLGKRTINNIEYELRPLFPNPNLILGWKF